MIADKSVVLSTPTELQTQQSHLKAEKITTEQRSLNTQNAIWEQTGTDELKLDVADTLQNQGGTFKTQGDLTIHSQGMDNRQGRLLANGQLIVNAGTSQIDTTNGTMLSEQSLSINSGELINNSGLIQANQNIAINTQGQPLSNNQSLTDTQDKGIVALGELNIQATNITNQQGRIVSVGNQTLNVTNIDNQQGLIYSQENLVLKAKNLTNDKGHILSAKQADIALSANFNQQDGILQAEGLNLTANSLSSTNQSVIFADQLNMTTSTELSNKDSRIISTFDGKIKTGSTLDNTNGTIGSQQNSLKIDTNNHILENKKGNIIAAQNMSIHSGVIENNQGLISANNIRLNSNNQSINNQDTLLENQSDRGIIAQDSLILNTGSLNNNNGNILSRKNSTVKTTSLMNNRGEIRTQSQLNLNTHTLLQHTGLITANIVNLVADSIKSNKQSEISGNQVNMTAQTLDNQESKLIAQHSAQIDVKQGIQNQNGVLASLGEKLTINSDQSDLNNVNGLISAQNGTLNLDTNTLNNQQGAIRAKAAGITTLQTLDNRNTLSDKHQGIVVTDLTLNAKQLDNQDGRVTVLDQATLQASDIHNQSGEILVVNDGLLTADKISNQAGQIVSTSANLTIATQTTLNNQQGIIGAENQLTLTTKGLDNQQGNITSSNQLVLNTAQQQIDNQHGLIFSKNQTSIYSGEMNNQNGLIRADNSLLIDANQNLINNTNTQDVTKGIIGLGSVVLQGVTTLFNQQGKLYGGNTLNITAVYSTQNQQGTIQSNGHLTLSTNVLDNQEGKLSSASANINAQTINNRATSHHGSLIYADKLTLNTEQLDNQSTKAKGNTPTQGIQGKDITLQTSLFNNQQGGIYSSNNVSITSNHRLDNQEGELLAVNTVNVLNSGHLTVNNDKGLIQGHKTVNLNAKSLESEGDISTKGDLNITLKDSFILNNAFEAGNLTLKTEGDFTNNAEQTIANKMTISANNIVNNANSELSSNETTLNSNTLTNRGLIDGVKTFINSTTVTNIGTGKIYGNHVAFNASTVENLAETVDGETKAGTIAARNRLDLGVDKLINRDNAYILSLGTAFIGNKLDENHIAIGQASLIQNESATIELLGNANVNAKRIENRDIYVKTKIREETEKFDLYSKENSQTKQVEEWYRDGVDGKMDANNGQRHNTARFIFFDKNKADIVARRGEFWQRRAYTQTRYIPEVFDESPAKILVGGNLDLNSQYTLNQYSQFLIGKQLAFNGKDITHSAEKIVSNGEIVNEDLTAVLNINNDGYFYRYYQDRYKPSKFKHHRFFFDEKVRDKIDQKLTETIQFDRVLNTIGTSISSNATIDEKTTVKAIQLDSISVVSNKIDKPNAISIGKTHLDSSISTTTEITLTPTVDNHHIISSGQVIAKLQTSVDKFDAQDVANMTMPMVKTHLPDVSLPQASLYKINPDFPNGYLVETDPKFTDRKQWLSSDYMFEQLRYNFDNVHKRLGDGFYEQRLINEQINQLTGRRYIEGYTNDLAQYKALMHSGVKYAQQLNLSVGIGLTAKQMSELTTDMVWLVNKEITLADGRKVTALVPQVYLVARNSDITSRGAVISANEIIGTADNLQNSGVIAGRDLTRIHSNQLENRGTILGDTVDLSAKQNLINLGGKIEAVKDLSLYAGKNLEISSTLSSSQSTDGNFARTVLDQLASVKVTGEGGRLSLHSDGNLTLKATNVESAGSLKATAGDSLQITTLQTHNKEHYGGGDNYYRLDQSQEVGSVLSAKDNLTLVSQNDTTLRQANIGSENGKVVIGSLSGDVNIEAGRAEEQLATAYKSTSRGRFGLSKTTETGRYSHDMDNAVVSRISGSDVNIFAQQGGVSLAGTQVAANQDITVRAAKDVVLDAAENYAQSDSYYERKKSGATASLSKGIASVGYARSRSRTDDDNRSTSVVTTVLNAATGNLTVASSDGDVIANAAQLGAGNDIRVQGQNVHFNALTETAANQFTQSAKSSGVGVSMVYDPASVVKENFKQQGDQNSAVGIIGTIINGADASSKTVNQLMNPGSPYANHQRSQSNKNSRNEQAVVGSVNAGGNLTVVATEGDITAQGTQFSAEGDGTLWAKEDVLLGVATSRQNQQSRTTRQAASLDLAKGGTSAAGAYADKGLGKGETLTEQAAVLSFGGSSNITAEGGNVELVGTQLVSNGANRIEAGQDVILRTAQHRTKLDEGQTAHSVGEVVISDTERFAGYNRKLQSQQGEQVTHQGAMIASLNNNVDIYAGNNFIATSGEILAKNRIDISAEEVTFEAAHNIGNSRSHQSDLKLGQFSRVSSPLIDLVQTVEQAANNHNANDRVQAAQALGAAAKAYTTAANLANGGALIRAETGTGYSHSRNKNQTTNRESVGNQLNAQHINITSRSGDINATHTAFTSKDEQGNRIADSSITFDSARDINFSAGQSEYQLQGRQQSSGFEAGTGVAVGAQTGWYFYAQAGFSNGKQDERHLTHHNTQIDSETVNIKSQGDTNLKGATARGNRINADIQGKLTIESLQDEHRSNSSSAGVGGRVQAAIGTAWGASGYGNLASGNANSKQVAEQSGLFAEDGGYNVSANEVSLIGGVIASTSPENSTLITNNITFSDIQNQSSSQAFTAGISGSANLNGIAGTQAKTETETEAKQQAEMAKLTGTPQSNGINPGLPMFEQSRDNSTTKATLTEGTIILHKDTNPTQTTAAALGINTDLSQANRQVAQPKDINQVLKEQQVFNQAIGNMQEAANTYAEQKAKVAAEAVNKAEEALQAAEKSGDIAKINEKQTAYAEAKAQAERWEDGGANKRNVDAAVATIGTILSGGNAGQTAVAVLSPELNAQIHELTKDSKTANLLAHAALSALEAKANGTSATAGAIAGAAGEATAMLLAEAVFNKQPNELTTEERNLLKVAGQLAGAVSGNLASSTTADAVIGAETAKRAVENNYLTSNEALKFEKELVECRKNNQDCSSIIQKYLDISNKRSQKLVDKCSDGGIRCAGMEEIIDAHTNVARVKNDTTGRIYLGTPLQDDEAIKFVSYLNNRDLSYLHNNVSTMDRALYYGADPTNWPFLLMGGRGLLTNNSKSALLSTTAAMGINAGGQYALTGDVNIPDLIMTGVIAKSTVNKGLTQTVNTNTLGSYYSSQINNKGLY